MRSSSFLSKGVALARDSSLLDNFDPMFAFSYQLIQQVQKCSLAFMYREDFQEAPKFCEEEQQRMNSSIVAVFLGIVGKLLTWHLPRQTRGGLIELVRAIVSSSRDL